MPPPTRREPSLFAQYLLVTAGVLGLSMLLFAAQVHLGDANTSLVYLLLVLYCATTARPQVTVLCGVISFLCYDFLFIPPIFDLRPINTTKLLDPLAFLIVALVTALLAERSRKISVQRAAYQQAGEFRTTLLRLVSHNLRTPVATIKTALSSVIMLPGIPVEGLELLRAANQDCDRLNRLIGNVLQIARLDAHAVQVNRDWYTLDEVVSSVFARWRAEQQAGLLTASIPPTLPLVSFDFALVENILSNLVENAFRHGRPPVVVALELHPGEVRVRVTDYGPGVPEPQRDALFGAFNTLSPGAGGLGLGLTVCKGLVEAHGGRISAEFEAGRTTFLFTLPCTPDPPEAPEPLETPETLEADREPYPRR